MSCCAGFVHPHSPADFKHRDPALPKAHDNVVCFFFRSHNVFCVHIGSLCPIVIADLMRNHINPCLGFLAYPGADLDGR